MTLPQFVSTRTQKPACTTLDLSQARRRKAARAAKYVIDQITRGQMGINLVQGFKLHSGMTVDATPQGFQLDYLGYKTAPCLSPAGAIMIWAHLVDREGTQ